MQDNNESEENTQNKPAETQAPTTPHVGGDVISPSSGISDNSFPKTEASPEPELSPLNHPSTDVTPESSKTTTPFPVSAEHGKKRLPKKVLLIIIILILAVAGAGAWLLMKNKSADTKKTANSQQIQEIDILRIGTVEGPASTFFPDEGLQGIYFGLNRQVYEGLVGFDNKAVTPLLAQSWTNPDEKTWIFKLKPNAKFHTGKPVTAQAVKESLEGLKDYEYWSIFISTIESVEAVSDTEVKIVTTEPDALLLNRLSLAFITDQTATDLAGKNGTGAYQVDSSATNDEKSTTLIAFDGYHGNRAKTRKLVYTIFDSDENLIDALKKGNIDTAETLTFPKTKTELTQAGFASAEYDSPGAFGLYMNTTRSATTILKNKDVRLAIALAMDRQGLVDKVGNKNTPATQVIPKSLPGYDASISFPAFNLTTAKETLAKTGYKTTTSLEFAYVKDLQQDAPVIIEQLRAAGFTIKEKVYTSEQTGKLIDDLKAGKFDLFAAGYSSDFIDARDVLGSLLHSTESSYPVFKDPAYDKILADSDKEFDPIKRTQALQQANKYILDNLAWIPLRNSVYAAYYKKDLNIVVDFYGGGNLGAYYRKVGRITN